MGLPVHTVEFIDGSNLASMSDRLKFAMLTAVPTPAGAGAGASVSVAVTFPALPSAYNVQVSPSQDAVSYVTNKTVTGFTVTLNPRLAANQLAVGTIDILLTA